MPRHTLKIEGTDISQYGIYISSDTYLNAPQIDYTDYQIPNRNGNMIQYNKRLNNVVRKFECYIPRSTEIASGLRSLKSLLYSKPGYLKLESDYDSGFIQYGYLAQEIKVNPFRLKNAKFDLYFSCQPVRIHGTNAAITFAPVFAPGSSRQAFVGVARRQSGMIQQMINALPMSAVPDADFFCVMRMTSVNTPYTLNQSVVASGNTGGGFAAICELSGTHGFKANQFENLRGYSLEGTPSASYNFNGTAVNSKPYLVFPIPTGTVTASCTDSTTTNYTLNFTDVQKIETISTAIGVNISKLEFEYADISSSGSIGTDSGSITILEGYSDNNQMWHFEFSVDFGSMPLAIRQLIASNYSTDSYPDRLFNMRLENGKLYVFKNTNTLDISEYAVMSGDLGGLGNKIKIIGLGGAELPYIGQIKIYPEWWNL